MKIFLQEHFELLCALTISLLVFAYLRFGGNAVFSNEHTYFYTFSTIVQGFVGLIAMLSAIVIYRFQLEENILARLMLDARPHLEKRVGKHAKILSSEEMQQALQRELKDESMDETEHTVIMSLNLDFLKVFRRRHQIALRLRIMTVCSLVNVGFALVCLPLSSAFALNLQGIGPTVICANIAASILCLFLAWLVLEEMISPHE